MDRGAWWATIHGVTESDSTKAAEHACMHPWICPYYCYPYQGSLACCSPWGRRVGHDWATELNWLLPFRDTFSWLWTPSHFHPTFSPSFLHWVSDSPHLPCPFPLPSLSQAFLLSRPSHVDLHFGIYFSEDQGWYSLFHNSFCSCSRTESEVLSRAYTAHQIYNQSDPFQAASLCTRRPILCRPWSSLPPVFCTWNSFFISGIPSLLLPTGRNSSRFKNLLNHSLLPPSCRMGTMSSHSWWILLRSVCCA